MKFALFSDQLGAHRKSPNRYTLADSPAGRVHDSDPVIFVGPDGRCDPDKASIAIIWDPGYHASSYDARERLVIECALLGFLGPGDWCQPLVHCGSEYIHKAQMALLDQTGASCRPAVAYRHDGEVFDCVCRLLRAAEDRGPFSEALERLRRSVDPPDVAVGAILNGLTGCKGTPAAGSRSALELAQAFRDWRHGFRGALALMRRALAKLAPDSLEPVRRGEYAALEDLPNDALSRHGPVLAALVARCGEAVPVLRDEAAALERCFRRADESWRAAKAEASRAYCEDAAARLLLMLDEPVKQLALVDEGVERICCIVGDESGTMSAAAGEMRADQGLIRR
jgi:hypothetical protein